MLVRRVGLDHRVLLHENWKRNKRYILKVCHFPSCSSAAAFCGLVIHRPVAHHYSWLGGAKVAGGQRALLHCSGRAHHCKGKRKFIRPSKIRRDLIHVVQDLKMAKT